MQWEWGSVIQVLTVRHFPPCRVARYQCIHAGRCANGRLRRVSVFSDSNSFSARMGYSVGRSGVELAATLCHVVDCLCANMFTFVNVHTSCGHCAHLLVYLFSRCAAILVQGPCGVHAPGVHTVGLSLPPSQCSHDIGDAVSSGGTCEL